MLDYHFKKICLSFRIPGKFKKLVNLLKTIPKEEVEDTETTYSMREKWMKFFTQSGKLLTDHDLALK